MGKGAFYTGKLALFLLKTVIALALIGAVLYIAFNTAMNIGSVYVLCTEGMELRADVALGAQDEGELLRYFAPECVEKDPLLSSNPYAGYRISGYSHSLKVEGLSAWAWSNSATVTVTEQVNRLTGIALDGAADAEGNPIAPPAWEECRHIVTLEKNAEGRWYITDVASESIQETDTYEFTETTAE